MHNPQSKAPFACRNLLLIGYRGTGKTTVGKLVAERLDWAFVDADDEIERRAGYTISEIFEKQGEDAFRHVEQQVVADLCAKEHHVISLGGGAVLREENRDAIRQSGTVIWLTASPVVIHQRLNEDVSSVKRRPDLTSQGGLAEIEQLLAIRTPLYEESADHIVDTEDRSAHLVVEAIVDLFSPPE